jgi:hypothetical protein
MKPSIGQFGPVDRAGRWRHVRPIGFLPKTFFTLLHPLDSRFLEPVTFIRGEFYKLRCTTDKKRPADGEWGGAMGGLERSDFLSPDADPVILGA